MPCSRIAFCSQCGDVGSEGVWNVLVSAWSSAKSSVRWVVGGQDFRLDTFDFGGRSSLVGNLHPMDWRTETSLSGWDWKSSDLKYACKDSLNRKTVVGSLAFACWRCSAATSCSRLMNLLNCLSLKRTASISEAMSVTSAATAPWKNDKKAVKKLPLTKHLAHCHLSLPRYFKLSFAYIELVLVLLLQEKGFLGLFELQRPPVSYCLPFLLLHATMEEHHV